MKLLVDRDIHDAAAAFAAFGPVRLFDGRTLKSADLDDTEVLIVRSVTAVNRKLLAGSAVRYVGTTTAGTDHVDEPWLAAQGITFTSAPGCNARAVAEHVLCCLVAYAQERDRKPADLRVGIVGFGQVGSALGTLLDSVGINYVVNDPPRQAALSGVTLASLEELLDCDVLTLHVPLTTSGPHPTRLLLNAARVRALPDHALLINAARGGVLDEAAVLARHSTPARLYAAIDCWAGEPEVLPAMLRAAWQATTHIAGHTLEARINAVRLQQQQLAAWSGEVSPQPTTVPPNPTTLTPQPDQALAALLEPIHPLATHTQRLRALAGLPGAARRAEFDRLRKVHGLRREFSSVRIACAGLDTDTVAQLSGLGFKLI